PSSGAKVLLWWQRQLTSQLSSFRPAASTGRPCRAAAYFSVREHSMNLRIFCLGIIVFLVGCDPAPIREAQREISDAMRDPGSANFRNSKIIEADCVTFV